MTPQRKSRRLAEPSVSEATEVQFVADLVEIQPQLAVAAFATGEDNRSNMLVSTIIAAFGTANNLTVPYSPPIWLEPPYKTTSHRLLADKVVRFICILHYSIVLQFL